MEDLSLTPRRCIWQHPSGPEPVTLSFPNVHLGTHVTFSGGLFFYHERKGTGAPVTMRVLVDGQEIGRMVHEDGEGFEEVEFDTRAGRPADAPARGTLRVEVTTPKPYHRSFCWAGSIRDAKRREGP